jgi:hypothetical protein
MLIGFSRIPQAMVSPDTMRDISMWTERRTPTQNVPKTNGNMHFGEHSPLNGIGLIEHACCEVTK